MAGVTDVQRFGVDEDERDAGGFGSAVHPGVVRAALDQGVAGTELHGRVVHHHVDFAGEDDHVVDRFGAVHRAVVPRRVVDDDEARAVGRRCGDVHFVARVGDAGADANVGRRRFRVPEVRKNAGASALDLRDRVVPEHFRDPVRIVARHDAANRIHVRRRVPSGTGASNALSSIAIIVYKPAAEINSTSRSSPKKSRARS